MNPQERQRRLQKFEDNGYLRLSDTKEGDKITIITHPAHYMFTVIRPQSGHVVIVSKQDENFEVEKLCQFRGCIWEDAQIYNWDCGLMRAEGILGKDLYPVIEFWHKFFTLSKIRQIMLNGEPFFSLDD